MNFCSLSELLKQFLFSLKTLSHPLKRRLWTYVMKLVFLGFDGDGNDNGFISICTFIHVHPIDIQCEPEPRLNILI